MTSREVRRMSRVHGRVEACFAPHAGSDFDPARSIDPGIRTLNLVLALFSGTGIGLLIGVLMGISVTPTVAVIIGALASGLAILLGLNDEHFNNAKAVRIGGFGFACVLGIYFGLYARTHQMLSPEPVPPPSLAEQKAEYVAMGFSEREALDFIAFSRFRIKNPSWILVGEPGAAPAGAGGGGESLAEKAKMTLLFGAEVNLDKCDELDGPKADFDLIDVVDVFDIAGGVWRSLAFSVRDEIGAPHGVPLLLAARDAFCDQGGQGMTKISDRDCQQLEASGSGDRTRAQQFEALGGAWQRLGVAVEGLGMDEAGNAAALALLQRDLCRKPA
jgi:hypothetical protein